MASTYTVNLGIEKIGTGEQSGTWGTTTNTNLDLIDQAVNGAVTVTLASAGTSGSPNTLAITNGAVSDGRNKFIDFADGGDLGATAYVQLDPNDAEKIVHIRNSLSGGRSLILFQGTYNASNDFEVPNGKDVVLKFDGGGATATITQVFEDLLVTAVAATTVDTTNIEVTNLKAKDGTSAGSIADSTGVVTIASSVLTTTDINGGSVDGVTLGTNSAVTEAQIDNININGNTISSTDTNGNVTITPDGTGSVAITKIDVAGGEIDGTAIGGNSASTATFTDLTASGTVSFSGATVSNGGTVTTVDINGGTIDGVTIGGSSAGAITGTTGQFNTSLNVDGTVTADGLNIDGPGGSGAKLVYTNNDQSNLRIQLANAGAGGNTWELVGGQVGANNADFTIYDASNTAKRALFSNNGDISFYEDTGTTAKLAWSASNERLTLSGSDYQFGIAQGANQPWYLRGVSDGGFRLHLNGTGDIVIADSSGNFLIGNTITNPASGFSNQKGFGYAAATGKVEIATTANDAVMEIGKNNANDGSLMVFRKQGNAVGSIGTASTYLTIGKNDTGLLFMDASDYIEPFDISTSAARDAAIDLGRSAARFKDLYLSGTAVINQTAGTYTIDSSSTTVIAASGTVDFANASGLLIVNNHSLGHVSIYIAGAGATTLVASVGSAVGTFTYNAGVNGYTFTNTAGSSYGFGFCFIRTRPNA
ncbi:MAG TPA: hypothetical protein VGP45_05785 [Marinobacter sp.]|nr:hypothetical protein [Marinobacter sp.]